MQRITTSTKAVDLFGSGKHGFKDGNLAGGIAATALAAEWFNGVQEEMLGIIDAAKIAPSATARNQVLEGIKKLFGGYMTTVASGTTALTIAQAGIILVDASAGNVQLNLPAAATLAMLRYRVIRTDSSAYGVTISRTGADTIDASTVALALVPGAVLELVSNGVDRWINASGRSNGLQAGDTIILLGRTTARAGTIKANGDLLVRADYPLLWSYAQDSGLVSEADWAAGAKGCYSVGNGTTTFRIPRVGGYFLRALDDGGGIDTGRTIGSIQESQNKSHSHTGTADSAGLHQHDSGWGESTGAPFGSSGRTLAMGAEGHDNDNLGFLTSESGSHTHSLSIDNSGGTEARSVNISALYCIVTGQ